MVREGASSIWEPTAVSGEGSPHRSRLVTYEIDDRGDLVSVLDAGGVETRYEYDDEHYLVAEHGPNGVIVPLRVRRRERAAALRGDLGRAPGRDLLAELGG